MIWLMAELALLLNCGVVGDYDSSRMNEIMISSLEISHTVECK
jgi:hypothetical protein